MGEEGELDNAAGPDGVRVRDVRRDALNAVSFPSELRALPMRDVALWVDPLVKAQCNTQHQRAVILCPLLRSLFSFFDVSLLI